MLSLDSWKFQNKVLRWQERLVAHIGSFNSYHIPECQYDFDPQSNPVGRDTLRKRPPPMIWPKYAAAHNNFPGNLTLSKFASLFHTEVFHHMRHALKKEPQWILDKFSDAQRKYLSKLKWKSDQCQSFILQMYFLISRTAWKWFPNSAFHRPLQSVDKEYFLCGCFGTDMLFSKLDTFYGPAASYIQFPNTHISLLKKQGHLCFHSLKRLFKFLL